MSLRIVKIVILIYAELIVKMKSFELSKKKLKLIIKHMKCIDLTQDHYYFIQDLQLIMQGVI